jgi:hypothetical protein
MFEVVKISMPEQAANPICDFADFLEIKKKVQ